MIAPKDSIDSQSTDTALPNSKKVYVAGKLHTDICVPLREISLAPTKSMTGQIERSAGASPVILQNEPVRVYDTSGPWGDPDFHGDVTQGLPALRAKWIRNRGDVEEYEERGVRPIDDGWLSGKHAAEVERKRRTPNAERPTSNGSDENSTFDIRHSSFAGRKPLRARSGCAVTRLAYARRGIITPEME